MSDSFLYKISARLPVITFKSVLLSKLQKERKNLFKMNMLGGTLESLFCSLPSDCRLKRQSRDCGAKRNFLARLARFN